MQLGIIGFPGSGKTTIFNLLTGSSAPVGELSGTSRTEFQTAVASVPEPRLKALEQLLEPQKTTCSQIYFTDIGGLGARARKEGLPASLLNQLASLDGLIHVVRAFENDALAQMYGEVDPQRDISQMETELILNDLLLVEGKLERLEEERGKGARDKSEIDKEKELFHRLYAHLSEEQGLRTSEFTLDDSRMAAGYGFLSRKPLLIIINHSENLEPSLQSKPQGSSILNVRGRLEMELGQLDSEDAKEFRKEYGLTEPARDVIIRAAYDLLSIISFFTFNQRELRAWPLKVGGSALDAAEVIHSDIARGFIRAEVIPWDELISLGGMSQARNAGKLRLEGKDYKVKDGEVIYIRFNI